MTRLGRVAFFCFTAVAALAGVGCQRPIEALSFSNATVDFGLNTRPFFLDVWNNNPEADTIRINIRPNRTWIKTDVNSVVSNPPLDPNGPYDKQSVRITIDRTQLNRGEHDGEIEFSADGVVSRTVAIHVVSDQDNNGAPLNLVNMETTYASPYLVEFSFALRDANSDAVVAEPGQFTLTAREDDTPVTFENGLAIKRAAARQLKTELLLDYSLSLQAVPGAINAMQDAAKNVFLPALNSDALVGITEFHAEDQPAARVAEFTTDREFLRQRINGIQNEYVQGFASFARIFDSILQVAKYFDDGEAEKEDRYIVLFTDGNDNSSVATSNQAVKACTDRNIKIYTVGVGQNIDELTLVDLATRTGGLYFPSNTAADLAAAFEKVINDLEAQYTVRWASAKLSNTFSFYPEFTLKLGNASVTHQSDIIFRPETYAGNPRRGELFFVSSDNTQKSTVFLRAQYIPRNVKTFTFDISSPLDFQVSKVETAEDGLVGNWTMNVVNTKATSVRIVLNSPDNTALPFAGFGPLLRFDFQQVIDPETLPFSSVTVDNTGYANGQFFVVDGF